MTLVIIIPFRNEASTIAEIVKKCLDLRIDAKVIAVDSQSTDADSKILLKEFLADPRFQLIRCEQKGKGLAVKAGLKAAGDCTHIVLQDADKEYDPLAIVFLVKMLDEGYESVLGVRQSNPYNVSVGAFLANKFFRFIHNIKHPLNPLSDPLSGQRGYEAKVLISISKYLPDNFALETALNHKLSRLKTFEFPVPYSPRTKDEGKKINIVDFFKISFWMMAH